MASSNLRNFGRSFQSISQNLTDFINYNNPFFTHNIQPHRSKSTLSQLSHQFAYQSKTLKSSFETAVFCQHFRSKFKVIVMQIER